MKFLDSETESYLAELTSSEPDILRELVRDSEENLEYTDMLSGKQVGVLLRLLVRSAKCRRILELGTFSGYSALWMAGALPEDGELITLEMNERYREISDRYFSRKPFNRIIRQIMGPALETLAGLEGPFDLVFVDADKAQYPDYYRAVKPLLNKNGLLVVDNALWGGSVFSPDDPKSRAVDHMNRLVHEDPDFENTILPVRDGLLVAVRV